MNDRWTVASLEKANERVRWNKEAKTRVARLFRHHVRTPSNPGGRIHREPCHFHPEIVGEAHHVDYARPFLVAWLCGANAGHSCHRKADHGSIKVTKLMLWDYSSLVVQRLGGRREVRRRGERKLEAVPF